MLRFVCWLSVLVVAWAVAAQSEPVPMHIQGELTPGLPGVSAETMSLYRQADIGFITFHHEGFAGSDADLFRRASAAREKMSITQRVRNIHRDHAVNAGLGMIAYHYVIDKNGQIAKGRPVRFKPGTRSTVWGGRERADFAGHFAVMVLGDFNHDVLTVPARQALVQVMSEAQRAYRVPTARILPHRTHANTSCPGKNLLAEAESLPRLVLAYSFQRELVARGCMTSQPDGIWGRASKRAYTRLTRQNREFAGMPISDVTLFGLMDRPGAICQ